MLAYDCTLRVYAPGSLDAPTSEHDLGGDSCSDVAVDEDLVVVGGHDKLHLLRLSGDEAGSWSVELTGWTIPFALGRDHVFACHGGDLAVVDTGAQPRVVRILREDAGCAGLLSYAEGALYTPIPMHLDDRREERPLPDCAAELVPAEPPEDEEPDTGGGGGGGGRSRRNQGCQAAPTGGGPAALPTRLLRR